MDGFGSRWGTWLISIFIFMHCKALGLIFLGVYIAGLNSGA